MVEIDVSKEIEWLRVMERKKEKRKIGKNEKKEYEIREKGR